MQGLGGRHALRPRPFELGAKFARFHVEARLRFNRALALRCR